MRVIHKNTGTALGRTRRNPATKQTSKPSPPTLTCDGRNNLRRVHRRNQPLCSQWAAALTGHLG